MAKLTSVPSYKGPQRARTRDRVAEHLLAGRDSRIRKWAEAGSKLPPNATMFCSPQLAADVLAILDELGMLRDVKESAAELLVGLDKMFHVEP